MGLGFGIASEIKKAVEAAMKPFHARFDAIDARLDAIVTRLDAIVTRLDAIVTRLDKLQVVTNANNEMLDKLQAMTNANNEMLHYLVAEVSRFKNESGDLMLSAFAFCTIHGVTFTHSDLFTYGGKATRYSRKYGFRIESVQDPRFGAVNLYEAEVLERVILGLTDEDYANDA